MHNRQLKVQTKLKGQAKVQRKEGNITIISFLPTNNSTSYIDCD